MSCSIGMLGDGGCTGTGPVLSIPGCIIGKPEFEAMKGSVYFNSGAF
jgi:hypothetical protein